MRSAFTRLCGMALALVLGISSAALMTKTAAAYDLNRGPNTSNKIILSFDDCPKSMSSFKATVLAAESMDIALFLFPTGNCISGGLIDVAYARAHGHYVFNHSVSHPDLRTLSYSGVQRQLGSPGVATTYGRPPYGAYNSTVASAYASVGMKIWNWNVDTNDWRGKSSSELVSYVVANARAGDTVLMHMQWNGFNSSTLQQMKAGLARRGLTVCKNYPGTTPVRPSTINCEGGPAAPVKTAPIWAVQSDGALVAMNTSVGPKITTTTRIVGGWSVYTWMGRVPDITKDGRYELLARRNDGTMWLFTSRPTGTFNAGVKVGSGWNGAISMTVLPDINRDGKPELVALLSNGRLFRYSVSTSTIVGPSAISTNFHNAAKITTLGDFSGDGIADLLAVHKDGLLVRYTLSSAGKLTSTKQVGAGWQNMRFIIGAGPMDNNSSGDLIALSSSGTLLVYANSGSGSLHAGRQIRTGLSGLRQLA